MLWFAGCSCIQNEGAEGKLIFEGSCLFYCFTTSTWYLILFAELYETINKTCKEPNCFLSLSPSPACSWYIYTKANKQMNAHLPPVSAENVWNLWRSSMNLSWVVLANKIFIINWVREWKNINEALCTQQWIFFSSHFWPNESAELWGKFGIIFMILQSLIFMKIRVF